MLWDCDKLPVTFFFFSLFDKVSNAQCIIKDISFKKGLVSLAKEVMLVQF
jgi:hypothetical protein